MSITEVNYLVGFVALICIAVIIAASSGFIEKHLKFAEWWHSDSSKWGFRLSVIGISFSIIAITLTFYFARLDEQLYVKLDDVMTAVQKQQLNIHNIESKLDAVISAQTDSKTSFFNIQAEIKALSRTITMGDTITDSNSQESYSDDNAHQ